MPPDADVALRLRRGAAGDERVRRDDHPADPAAGRVGVDRPGRGGQHRRVRPLRAQVGRRGVGQQVRDAVDAPPGRRRRPARPAGRCRPSRVRRWMPAASLRPDAEAQPHRRVVVPAGQSTGMPARANAGERVVEQRHRVGRRDGPVIHVARDHDRVGAAVGGQREQPVQEPGRRVEQALPVQGAPEMPVRGMDQSHRLVIMPGGSDSSGYRRPARLAALPDCRACRPSLSITRWSRTSSPRCATAARTRRCSGGWPTSWSRCSPTRPPATSGSSRSPCPRRSCPEADGVRLQPAGAAGGPGAAGRRRHAGRHDPAAAQRRRRVRGHGPRRADAARVDLRRAAARRPGRPRRVRAGPDAGHRRHAGGGDPDAGRPAARRR